MPKDNEVDEKVVAYGRDLDGTGSLHPCAKDDSGAIALYDAATVAELRAEVEKARIAGIDACEKLTALWQKDIARADAAERRVGELEANDRRYRFLREKVCIIGTEHLSYTKAVFEFVNLPYPTYVAPSAAYELDAAIDALTGADPT